MWYENWQTAGTQIIVHCGKIGNDMRSVSLKSSSMEGTPSDQMNNDNLLKLVFRLQTMLGSEGRPMCRRRSGLRNSATKLKELWQNNRTRRLDEADSIGD